MTSSALVLAAVAAVGQASGEPVELVTDRPDQTESSSTVPAGTVQIEAGWLHEDIDGHVSSETAPGVLLRIGFAEELELRIGWSGWIEEEIDGGPPPSRPARVSGSGDAEVGLKWHLWSERGSRPDVALLVGTSIPVGSAVVSSDAWDPSLRFALAHELAPSVGLGYNVGYAWETSEMADGTRSRHGAAVWTAALGFALSDEVGAFVELFGALPDEGSESSLDGGFTWLVRSALQIDVYAGVGLTSNASDTFAGLGLSFRLPR